MVFQLVMEKVGVGWLTLGLSPYGSDAPRPYRRAQSLLKSPVDPCEIHQRGPHGEWCLSPEPSSPYPSGSPEKEKRKTFDRGPQSPTRAEGFFAAMPCHSSFFKVCGRLLTLRLLMSYIYGAPILDVSRSRTTTQHSRLDSSGRAISSSQRPLPDNTTLTTDKYPCPRWDLNLRSQQASGLRPGVA
jgi:hypothetical protein